MLGAIIRDTCSTHPSEQALTKYSGKYFTQLSQTMMKCEDNDPDDPCVSFL